MVKSAAFWSMFFLSVVQATSNDHLLRTSSSLLKSFKNILSIDIWFCIVQKLCEPQECDNFLFKGCSKLLAETVDIKGNTVVTFCNYISFKVTACFVLKSIMKDKYHYYRSEGKLVSVWYIQVIVQLLYPIIIKPGLKLIGWFLLS